MSESSSVLPLTSQSMSRAVEDVVSLSGAELRRMHEALLEIADESPSAARLVEAISEVLAKGADATLVVTRTGGSDDGDYELREQLARLVDDLTPQLSVPSEAAVILSRRNAKRRIELLAEFGALTGEQIAEERSRAQNRHALAARWRKEGRIFGVPYRGQTLYPAFQFDENGDARPVIREILTILPINEMTEWEVGFWWTAPNGWLNGQRPVDVIDGDPGILAAAARQLAQPPAL